MRPSLILGEDEVFLSATKRGLFVSPTGVRSTRLSPGGGLL
jgi:hypothetical protein